MHIHAEGTTGGELKHGPIARSMRPSGHRHVQRQRDQRQDGQQRSPDRRNAPVLALVTEGDIRSTMLPRPAQDAWPWEEAGNDPEHSHAATRLSRGSEPGQDVDQPRNLAKIVTVEDKKPSPLRGEVVGRGAGAGSDLPKQTIRRCNVSG
jgi:hypothetical protein